MDRHGFIQPVLRQHKAANMLGQMTRKFEYLLHESAQARYFRIVWIKTSLPETLIRVFSRPAPPNGARKAAGNIFRQAQRLAHFSDGAA